MKSFRNDRRSQGGVILLVVAAAIVVLVAIAGLSIDAGRMFSERRDAQSAADAAALAAASDLYDAAVAEESPLPTGQARQSALKIAADNGYDNDGSASTVTVNAPPNSGEYAGQEGYVEVIIESRKHRSFSHIFGHEAIQVKARSVAAGTLLPTKATVLVLEPKKEKALDLKKGGTLLEAAGDIIVNSTHKKAAEVGSGAELIAENILFASKLDKKVVRMLDERARGNVMQKVDPTPDPLAGLPEPQGGAPRKLSDYLTTTDGKRIFRLKPGDYDEKLKFQKTDEVYLEEGVYSFTQGLEVKEGAKFSADNVVLHSSGKKNQIKFSSSDITLSPPTSGPYAGVSIFMGRQKKGKVEFKKDTNPSVKGTIYAPNAEVKFKQTILDLEGEDDAEDEEGEAFDESDDGASPSFASLGASIIARKLKIDKKSHIVLTGNDIPARMPCLMLVE